MTIPEIYPREQTTTATLAGVPHRDRAPPCQLGQYFGANPLQQTLGLAKPERVAILEMSWPTSGTTQTSRDVRVNQAIEITEFATEYRKLDWKPIPAPK